MRRVIEHEEDARTVATAVVLDDLRAELEGFDEQTAARVRAMLFSVVEDTIAAVRAGEAYHLKLTVEDADDRASEAFENRLDTVRESLRGLAKCKGLDEVVAAVENVVEKLG